MKNCSPFNEAFSKAIWNLLSHPSKEQIEILKSLRVKKNVGKALVYLYKGKGPKWNFDMNNN
jgi:hypothetical protein